MTKPVRNLCLTNSSLLHVTDVFSILQQPQSPKEQPKKGDQKGDDNKKQGGKHLYEPIFYQDSMSAQ